MVIPPLAGVCRVGACPRPEAEMNSATTISHCELKAWQFLEIAREAYPEHYEIPPLYFVQDQNDMK